MSHVLELQQWTERVQQLFPALKPHHARNLAHYTFGVVLTRSCSLVQVAASLAALLDCSFHTIRARLRELYQPATAQRGAARSAFDHTRCFGPLLRWAASAQHDQHLILALDPTCHRDRFRVLAIGVLHQGGGLPVAWVVQHAHEKGSWNDIWIRLLGQLRAALGAGWTVLVLTDRGLESVTLFRAIVALGWHPLMRAKAGGTFQPAGWYHGYALPHFARAVGRRWAGVGVAYPLSEPLPCTLLASWEAGHDEAWLLLTDLPATAANPAWYAFRMWMEQGFKVLKSGCWQWQQTRMTEASRAARLWAVLAVATLWMVEVGGTAEQEELSRGHPAATKPKAGHQSPPRRERLVKRGQRVVVEKLLQGLPLPHGRLKEQPSWPQRDWQPDQLTEEMMH